MLSHPSLFLCPLTSVSPNYVPGPISPVRSKTLSYYNFLCHIDYIYHTLSFIALDAPKSI
ncbi:hypothetical protein LguiA_005979 [Lonicera macranthoides]